MKQVMGAQQKWLCRASVIYFCASLIIVLNIVCYYNKQIQLLAVFLVKIVCIIVTFLRVVYHTETKNTDVPKKTGFVSELNVVRGSKPHFSLLHVSPTHSLYRDWDWFLKRVRIARSADRHNSQRMSVHPSVTFRCFIQTNEHTIVWSSASVRTIILVSEEVKFIEIFAGEMWHIISHNLDTV